MRRRNYDRYSQDEIPNMMDMIFGGRSPMDLIPMETFRMPPLDMSNASGYDVVDTQNPEGTYRHVTYRTPNNPFAKKVPKEAQTDMTGTQLPPSSEILGRCWISGNILKQYFDIINVGPLKEKNGHILNPLVGYLLKTMKDSENFIAKQNFPGLKFLIIPVSNAKFVNQAGQCHWSVLVFCKNSKTFYYFDSLKTHNLEDAKIIKNKLMKVLGTDKDDPIKVCRCPEQKVNYECGIHTIFAVECLVKDIIANKGVNVNCLEGMSLDEMDLILKRCFLAYVLQNKESLSKEKIFSIMFDNFQQKNPENQLKSSLIKSIVTAEAPKQIKKNALDSQSVKGAKVNVPQTHNPSKDKTKKNTSLPSKPSPAKTNVKSQKK